MPNFVRENVTAAEKCEPLHELCTLLNRDNHSRNRDAHFFWHATIHRKTMHRTSRQKRYDMHKKIPMRHTTISTNRSRTLCAVWKHVVQLLIAIHVNCLSGRAALLLGTHGPRGGGGEERYHVSKTFRHESLRGRGMTPFPFPTRHRKNMRNVVEAVTFHHRCKCRGFDGLFEGVGGPQWESASRYSYFFSRKPAGERDTKKQNRAWSK